MVLAPLLAKMFSTKLLHKNTTSLKNNHKLSRCSHYHVQTSLKKKIIRKLGNQPVKVREIIITISIIIFTKGIKETVYVLQDSSQFATEIIHPFIQTKKKKSLKYPKLYIVCAFSVACRSSCQTKVKMHTSMTVLEPL